MEADGKGNEEEWVALSSRLLGSRLDGRHENAVSRLELKSVEVDADGGLGVWACAPAIKDVRDLLPVLGDPPVSRQIEVDPVSPQEFHLETQKDRHHAEGHLAGLGREGPDIGLESQGQVLGQPASDLDSSSISVCDLVVQKGKVLGNGGSGGIVKGRGNPETLKGDSHSGKEGRRLLPGCRRAGMLKPAPDRALSRRDRGEAVAGGISAVVGPGALGEQEKKKKPGSQERRDRFPHVPERIFGGHRSPSDKKDVHFFPCRKKVRES